MDRWGVEVSRLSISSPGVHFGWTPPAAVDARPAGIDAAAQPVARTALCARLFPRLASAADLLDVSRDRRRS